MSEQHPAARRDEFLRGQRVMRESGVPPLGVDYWYRCGACGNVSPANRWPGRDATLTCPVCKFVHTDTDDDPGVEDGTFEELRRG